MPTSAAIFEKVLLTEEKKNNKKTNSSFSLLKEETKKNHPERLREKLKRKKKLERDQGFLRIRSDFWISFFLSL
jgi:hypothetical protein